MELIFWFHREKGDSCTLRCDKIKDLLHTQTNKLPKNFTMLGLDTDY